MIKQTIVRLEDLRSTDEEKSKWVHVDVPRNVPKSINQQIPAYFFDIGKAEAYAQEMAAHLAVLRGNLEIDTLEYRALQSPELAESIRKTANAMRVTATKKNIVEKAIRVHCRSKGITCNLGKDIEPRIAALEESLGAMTQWANGRIRNMEKLIGDIKTSTNAKHQKAKAARHLLHERIQLNRNFLAKLAHTVNPDQTNHMPWIAEKIAKFSHFGKDL